MLKGVDMKSQTKFVILIALVVVWISFIKWADTSLPSESSAQNTESTQPIGICQKLRIDKETLENEASTLAKEAFDLQSDLMRGRLSEIVESRILSKSNSDLLVEYLSFDIKKLIEEKSDVFGENFKRNMEIRPTVIKIVERLILQGQLQPYYFEEVQKMGESLRGKFAIARNIVDSNPECFKLESEMNQMIEKANKELKLDQNYNGWTTEHSAEELVEAIQ